MKAATIIRKLKEYATFNAAVAAGRMEIAHRDSLLTSMSIGEANKRISFVTAGFAAPEFWAASTDDVDLIPAFEFWQALKDVDVVPETMIQAFNAASYNDDEIETFTYSPNG